MDNWSRGWRKLVEWDNGNKVYTYKGHKIYPLSYKEQVEMATHLQNSYYWGEIAHIDRIIEAEEIRTKNPTTEEIDFNKLIDWMFDI